MTTSRRRRLQAAAIAIVAIGFELAFVTYRFEMRTADARTAAVQRTIAAANRRQTGILYGPAVVTMIGWMDALETPAGHAALIALASAIAAIVCFRGAHVAGPEDE